MNRAPYQCPRTGLTVWPMIIESPLGGFWVMAVDAEGRNQGKRETTPDEWEFIKANYAALADEWDLFAEWIGRKKPRFEHWGNPFRIPFI